LWTRSESEARLELGGFLKKRRKRRAGAAADLARETLF
jgi:hypothetical protein